METTIRINDVESFKKDLSNLDFIKLDDAKESGCLVLKKEGTKWQRFFNSDWVLQIQKDKKTKEWFAMDLEYITNLKLSELVQVIQIILNHTQSQGKNLDEGGE